MAAQQYHLWRTYPAAPVLRWACTVEKAETPDGYRIVDLDEHVADHTFLHALATKMRSEVVVRASAEVGEGRDMRIYERVGWVPPRSVGHFETAIREVPDSYLRGEGRPV